MTEAVEYRQFADEGLKAIWVARVPKIRALLLSMANRWIELAEQAERAKIKVQRGAIGGRQKFADRPR
jgi:hypothetical protein